MRECCGSIPVKMLKSNNKCSDSNLGSEVPQMEKLDVWTEVRSSRKSRLDRQHPPHTPHILHKNTTNTQQEVSVKKTKSSTSLKKDGSKKNETKRYNTVFLI